ncbi:MAG: heme-binding protein, partial [Bacteroidota bacterium]
MVISLGSLSGLFAQNVNQLQLAGDITSAEATKVVQAAERLAKADNVLVNIAVVDAGGNLKAFLRMDGSFLGSIDVAIKKAKTARYFNCATGDLGKITQPGGPIYQIEYTNGGLVSFPGGVPIKDENGVIIGAVGISGGTIDQDHQLA